MIKPQYLWLVGVFVLGGCAAPKGKAPVETRAIGSAQTTPAKKPSVSGAPVQQPPSASAAQEPEVVPAGFYRVKRGDTLISIALEQGVDWRDLASWNDISNPNIIEVGRLLRVLQSRPQTAPAPSVAAVPTAPVSATGATQTAPVVGAGAVQVRPIETSPVAGGSGSPSTNAPAAPVAGPPPTELASVAPPAVAAGLQWAWPANGQLISGFAEGGSKGVAIAGAPGEAVFAAESGRVIYSGNGLRGYGNLVIVKHEQDFTTAYAHNRTILVREGQTVRRGQKIAELGMSDADRPMLHFEVRRSGKPVDPLSFLPSR